MVVDHQRLPVTPAAAPPQRVLVVDDEETVMLTIKGILELDGYEVSTASTGEHALDLLRSEQFDLVLTDLRLETGVDGIDLMRAMHGRSADGVSIMLTGYASLESALSAMRAGAFAYLCKPCDVLELRSTVSQGLERARLAAELRARMAELEQANETVRSLNLELEARVDRAAAALLAQGGARDEFMAAVAHDLKSPLTFIKGLASLRRRRAQPTAETQPLIEALGQIEASAGRMAVQLDEIVDASRLDAGRPLDLRCGPTDLVALARKAVAEQGVQSERHVLQVDAHQAWLIGQWDGARLRRVFDELLGNALKFSPRGGAIEVRIDQQDGEAVVQVRDRGEGIAEVDLAHVFQRRASSTGRIPRTGIGLRGVRRIVEQHHGSISVASHVGEGTTFTIRLPLSD
jgi:signal transduction histidine kinase